VLRILALTSCYPDSGRPGVGGFVERQLLALARRDGVEVEVVAPVGIPPFPLSLGPRYRNDRRLPGEEVRSGIRVHRPRFTRLPSRFWDRSAAIARAVSPSLAEIRRRFPFDLIHAEFFWPDGPAAMRLAREFGVPFSVKARGGDFERRVGQRFTRALVLQAGDRAARLLAVSESLREAMIAAGLPADRIAVHHTGLDRSLFQLRDRAAAKAALKVEGPLLLSVGNLIPRKRQRLAIEALAHLERATLIIVGGGPDRAMLEKRIRELGLGGRVRLMGRLPQPLLPFVYAAADVTVHTAELEGLANVWVESLACGTPVVATEAGGAREILDRPEAGRVVEARPEAIAAAISDLLESPPDPARVAAAAGRFSWERGAAELEAHLRAALSSG
jgi:teichuronic acid biosynthesis glycosyltransferase TuaC